MAKVIGVIPARYNSVRFPGKVLAPVGGKPLIQRVWERARQCRRLEDVLIACDHPKVFEAVKSFGGRPVMTDENHPSGTDRIAEAVKNETAEIIVNIQGDEPLVAPEVIDRLAGALMDDKKYPMASVMTPLRDEEAWRNPNVVKVVVNRRGEAMYFSRAAVPYNRDGADIRELRIYKHLGLYAYRRDFLMTFAQLPESLLEQTEKLEQLRVLEAGFPIKMIETEYDSVGVDTPDDIAKVEAKLQ